MPEQELLGYKSSTLIVKRRFSSLYLATTHTQEQIVIKLFDSIALEKFAESQGFLADVEKSQALSHPLILSPQDMGIERLQPYIISSYMHEGSLRMQLNQARLPLERVLKLIEQIGLALVYAHSQGMLHGNIKPENILFDEQKNAVLADFYLPSLRQKMQEIGLRPDLHTMAYMAPETFHGKLYAQSDQYSLACLAFEMITGSVPFPAVAFATSQSKHATLAPPSLKSFVPALPDHIEATILKAMSKQPDERYRDIAAFIDALISSTPEGCFTIAEPARIPALSVLPEQGVQGGMSESIADAAEDIFTRTDIQMIQLERESSRPGWLTHYLRYKSEEKTAQVALIPMTAVETNVYPAVNHAPSPELQEKFSNGVFSLSQPISARFPHTRASMSRLIVGVVVLVLISLLIPFFLAQQSDGQNHGKADRSDVHCGKSTTCFTATRDGQSQNGLVGTSQNTASPSSPQRNVASPAHTQRGATLPPASTSIAQTIVATPTPSPNVVPVSQVPTPTPVPTQVPTFYSVGNADNTLSGGAKLVPCDLCRGKVKTYQVGSGAILTMNDISAARTGNFAMTIDYVNGDSQPRTAYLSVNGGTNIQVSFPSTGTWETDTPGSVTAQIPLQTGMNSIKFFNASASTPDFAGIIV